MSLFLALVTLVGCVRQDPTPESLIDRLQFSDPDDREKAAAKLAAGGTALLPQLDKATGRIKDQDVLDRIEQVRLRIRLGLHTPALDGGFSPGYRKAAADLIELLRHPSSDLVLEAIESTTGRRFQRDIQSRWVLRDGVQSPGTTQADATLVFRIALSMLPIRDDSDAWEGVKVGLASFGALQKTATLMRDCRIHLEDPDRGLRYALLSLSEYGQRRADVPTYLRLLDSAYPEVAQHAAHVLSRLNPGEHAVQVAARVSKVGERHRPKLIDSLARTGDDRWKDLYSSFAEDSNLGVQASAVRALGSIDAPAAIPHVIRMMRSTDASMRMAGLQAVPAVFDHRLSRELELLILKSEDEQAIHQALFKYSVCLPEGGRAVLEKAAGSSSPAVKRAASHFLEHLRKKPERMVAGASMLVNLEEPGCASKLIEHFESENEQAAFSDLMRLRSPRVYEDLLNLDVKWPADRHPTVKELLESSAAAMRPLGYSLDWKLAAVDERIRVRRNSIRPVVALLFWLIPSSSGHEYGWTLEEGKLTLLPINEVRTQWREWVRNRK